MLWIEIVINKIILTLCGFAHTSPKPKNKIKIKAPFFVFAKMVFVIYIL